MTNRGTTSITEAQLRANMDLLHPFGRAEGAAAQRLRTEVRALRAKHPETRGCPVCAYLLSECAVFTT